MGKDSMKLSNRSYLLGAVLSVVGLAMMTGTLGNAQENSDRNGASASIGSDERATIIVEAHGELPEPPVFFTASARATVQVGAERIEQVIRLGIKVIQGDARTLSFGLNGNGEVTDVQGENLQSWSIRQVGAERFLDLQLKENVTEANPEIKIRSSKLKLPASIDLTHLAPGESVGFESKVSINYAPEVEGAAKIATGFMPLDVGDKATHFQTTTGGQIRLSLNRSGASPAPAELIDTKLDGELHSNGESIQFQLRGTARVTEANAEITVLSGNAAVSEKPSFSV